MSREEAIDIIRSSMIQIGRCNGKSIFTDAINTLLDTERKTEVRINLNEPVMVKLTDLGKEIYYHRFDDLNQRVGKTVLKPSFPAEDSDGYTKFQLWEFMELYGEHIGMTKPNVIKPLEIVYREDGE